ncbi:MAG: class I SAM-dependent methyltransferase [Acidimicrobiales bacterium]
MSEDEVAVTELGRAERRWSDLLQGWAIPDALLASAPEPPYFFDPQVFEAAAVEALARGVDTVSDSLARELLPAGGSVLDVGAGGGAASLRLGTGGARVVGVDPSPELLGVFRALASSSGVRADAHEGSWPGIAGSVPGADVVVCHNVVYNVASLAAFVDALDAHAKRRVVVELTAEHPMSWTRPYWKALHGLVVPDGPTADDAVAVLVALGLAPQLRRWTRVVQMIGETGPGGLSKIARRLCIGPDRYDELRRIVAEMPPPARRDVVTVWWDKRR